MKKWTALAAGVLLLSSSVLVGCNNNAADRADYDATRGGRVMGTDNDRIGVNMSPVRDRDRLGTIDDIGPDNARIRGGAYDRDPDLRGLTLGDRNDLVGRDRDRLGVNDNIGPDNGRNMRNDKALEAKVEAIPGVRDAKVLVAGNTAYVGLNTGQNTLGTGRTGTLTRNNRTGTNAGGTAGTGTTGGTMGTNTGAAGGGTMNGTLGGTMGTNNGAGSASLSGRTLNRGNVNSTHIVRDYGVSQYGGTMSDRDYSVNRGGIGAAGRENTNRAGGIMGTGIADNRNNAINGTNGTNDRFGLYADDFVSSDLKGKVASAIRSSNPKIQNVYVSANPAMVNRMGTFVRDTAGGHPVRGANDLGDMFRRMFPASR